VLLFGREVLVEIMKKLVSQKISEPDKEKLWSSGERLWLCVVS